MNGRTKLPIKDWQAEQKGLLVERYLLCEKYCGLKDEVRSVEVLGMGLERLYYVKKCRACQAENIYVTTHMRLGSSLNITIYANTNSEVIFIEELKDLIVIRQQIMLNSRMLEMGRIPKNLHDLTYNILIDRLTKTATHDTIVNN